MVTCKAESIHVPKATHIRHFQQSLVGEMQVVVRLDGNALLFLLTLQQPVQAHHIALLLHMRSKFEVFVRGYEVCHVLGPILIHLNSRNWRVAPNVPFFCFWSLLFCCTQCLMTEHVMPLHTCTLHAMHVNPFLDGTSLVECRLVHLGSIR